MIGEPLERHGVVEVRIPGDKSITHRALILAVLAQGTSLLRGLLAGDDARATARVLRALGAAVPELPQDGTPIAVAGLGLRGLKAPGQTLDCENSGTTARLLLGVLAGFPFSATLTGDASLRSRPMRRVTEPLSLMGARFEELGETDRLPITISGGALRSIDYVNPKSSAQVKSAILLAGMTGGAEVRIREAVPSRDHTERMLRAMGADLTVERNPETGTVVTLDPPELLEPLNLTVPGDFSSAAFFLAAGLLASRGELVIRGVGVNPTRTGLLDVLRRMGAEPELIGGCDRAGEPVADIVVNPAVLQGTRVEAQEIPSLVDEVPVIAILAARAEGATEIVGAGELRIKESDRLKALAQNLRAIGVEVQELPDGLRIQGTDAPLKGKVRSFGDHRIAMAFGVLATQPGNEIEIDDPDVARISFPDYWNQLHGTVAALSA